MKKFYSLLAVLGSVTFSSAQTTLCVTDISYSHMTVSIHTSNGNVYTWGENAWGQVGNGGTAVQNTPWIRPSSPQFARIHHSVRHSVAVDNNGKVYTWGINERGGLGDGTIINQNTPIQVGTDNNWIKAEAGNWHTVALKSNGTLWGWGNNSGCELTQADAAPYPNNYYKLPVQINADNTWTDISAGGPRTFGIKSNGTLWGRGRNNGLGIGVPIFGHGSCVYALMQVGTSSDWKKVYTSNGGNFTLALKTDNTLWGWGDNIEGAVGTGVSQLVQTPVQIGTDTWKDVSAGFVYSVGIKSDGTLWGWGRGCWESLTSNNIVPLNTLAPVQVGSESNWLKVAAGGCSMFALRNDNTVWAWGAWGKIWNNGNNTYSYTPTLVFQCALSTSENEKDLSNLVLYPNPTVDRISWAQNIPIEKVTIYDMTSRKLRTQIVSESSVNVSDLAKGTYMIRLESKDKTFYNSKFVKN